MDFVLVNELITRFFFFTLPPPSHICSVGVFFVWFFEANKHLSIGMKLDVVFNSKGRMFQMQLMMAASISAYVLFPSGLC